MPGPSDDTIKQLTEISPQDWLIRGGWKPARVTLIDADIATISGAADKVIRVAGPPDWLLAVDFQAGHDTVAKLPDLLLYNSAFNKRHDLPVRTLLVILHKGADSPQLNGYYERSIAGEPFDVAMRYRVLRIWEVPVEQLLTGGLGLVPLAPLGDVRQDELPGVIARMKQRLSRNVSKRQAAELWSATSILMGLRYEQGFIQNLLRGVISMEESVTYQAILKQGEAKGEARGKAEEARRMLLIFGSSQLGDPSAKVEQALDAISDVKRLEEMGSRVHEAASWEELLGMPGTRRRSRRKSTS